MKITASRFFVCTLALILLLGIAGSGARAQEAHWLDNYDKALAMAKSENRNVLLDFTGSDWCPYCIQMHKEVLDTKEFKEYAEKNLVLLTVDFPQSKQLPQSVQDQNNQLQQKYDVQAFPTFILLDGKGRVLVEHDGYVEGGPSAFIAMLQGKKT
jgi:thioredoxin-related protein